VPAPSLDALDEPKHMQERRLFDFAFRASAVKEIEPYVEELAYRLIDDFLPAGRCEWVTALAIRCRCT
jgi:cytochrome P450